MSGERLRVPGEVSDWPHTFELDGVEHRIDRPSPVWIHERLDENRKPSGTFRLHNVLTSIYSKAVTVPGEEDDLVHGNLESMDMETYRYFKQFFQRHFVQPLISGAHPDVPAEIDRWPYQFESEGVRLELQEPNPAWVQKQQDESDSTIDLFRRCYEYLIIPVESGESARPELGSSWDHYRRINTLLGRFVVGPLVRTM